MWELWVHLDYDHLYIPLTSKWGKFQPQTNISPGNNNPFSIKPSTVVWVKISEKKNINFFGLKSLYLFQIRQNKGLKYGHLIPPWVFPNKIIPVVIDFTDEAVVQYDVPLVKILL